MNGLFKIARPMVYITFLFSWGIIGGYLGQIAWIWVLPLLAAFFIWIYIKQQHFDVFTLFLLVLFLLWGYFWLIVNTPSEQLLANYQEQNVDLLGQVHSINGQNNQFLLAVSSCNGLSLKIKPTILVTIPSYLEQENIVWGDQIKIKGLLLETASGTNPGEFSERDFWKNQAVNYKLIARYQPTLLSAGAGYNKFFNNLRVKIHENISQSIPQPEASLALGLVLGDKSQMDDELYTMFQRLGVVHIFAVSGLHVGVLVGLYIWVMELCRISKKISTLGALIIFGGYAILTGLTPSVLRASVMALISMLLINNLMYRDKYSILALAAFIILVINPYNLFQVGFQLSFVTTWGLLYLHPMVQKFLYFLPVKIRNILAVPIAAQLAACPLTIYYFNTLSIWAPVANIFYVFLVGLLVPLLFLALLLSLIFFVLAEPFLYLAAGILFVLGETAILLTKTLPFSSFYVGTPDVFSILLYYVLLIGLAETERLKKFICQKYRLLIAVSLIVVLLIFSLPAPKPLEYIFLDVGQGDAIVICTPYNQFIVLDGGPMANRVINYLQFRGVNKVQMVILSHGHDDHLNGLYQVLEQIPVDLFLFSSNEQEEEALQAIKNLAISKETKVIAGHQNMMLKCFGGLNLKIISPSTQDTKLDANNGSLIIQAEYGQTKTLFTGDAEQDIINKIRPLLNKVEILKVPHHGSQTSYTPSFYDSLDPQIAVIQSGQGNRYNHPHPEVVQALMEKGVRILRNDQHGAIIIKNDGDFLEIETFLKNSAESK